ncbi:MAG: hypothetical protein S4CHLAM123_11440 [Chlamydiales bacterium]|nr:hypothetical protein [Chlamydiales bacterium]
MSSVKLVWEFFKKVLEKEHQFFSKKEAFAFETTNS